MGPGLSGDARRGGLAVEQSVDYQLAVLRASMDIFEEAGMDRLRDEKCNVDQLPGVLLTRFC